MKNNITAEEFDKKFDDNEEDIMQYVELSSAHRPNQQLKRVNVDFPAWMVEGLDRQARRLGIPRQALIKIWIADRLG